MASAYVDTSCLLAVAFDEPGSTAMRRRLGEFDDLLAAGLLDAEFRSALRRERVDAEPSMLDRLTWIVPECHLRPEIARVLSAGYLRGADCWHLAAALYVAGDPASLSFVTLDERQAAVASKLGFKA